MISHPEIRLYNVKFSPNLGDGLLSECLEQALIDHGAAPTSHSIDLAARSGYAMDTANRSLKLRVLEAMPGALRPLAVRLPLWLESERRWGPHYAAGLEGADCAVIGGGNLLADLDLNFPTKLALAIRTCAAANVPVFIYGCGVSSGWSERGKALLHEALDTGAVKAVFLRDERSREIWDAMFGEPHDLPSEVVRDPGLLASEVYAPQIAQMPQEPPRVGLNITSQIAVRYHSADAPGEQALRDWYVDLARELLARGNDLCVFVNGSPEDRAFRSEIAPELLALAGPERVSFPDCRTPADLVAIIAGLKAVVAFRMHAIIAAYSLGVPFLALSWDPKLDSFVQSVQREGALCKTTQTGGKAAAAQLLERCTRDAFDPGRSAVLAEARADVGRLYARISAQPA